jgi:tetratricopeptide (TPR) repeat protein
MLRLLGGLDLEQEWYKEALAIYYKAQAVLAQQKEGNDCGALVNDMALCHENLQQWSEAVACYKEAVEHSRNLHGNNHPEYATTLYNLALLFARLKQYEEAIPRLEEALAIRQRMFADQHKRTVRPRAIRSRCHQCGPQLLHVQLLWSSQRSSSPVPAIVRGTAMPTVSCSTGRRTSCSAARAFTAARCSPR